jgi:hypothetical protein
MCIPSVTFQQRSAAPLRINYTFVLAGASSSLAQISFQSNLSHKVKMMREGLAVEIQGSLKFKTGSIHIPSLLKAEVWAQQTVTSNLLKPQCYYAPHDLTLKISTFCLQSVFVCFILISERTKIMRI